MAEVEPTGGLFGGSLVLGEVSCLSPSAASSCSSPRGTPRALSADIDGVADSDSTRRLTWIPEQNCAVAHRFTVVLCGHGASDLVRSLCTSDINEEYRPKRRYSNAMRGLSTSCADFGQRCSGSSHGVPDFGERPSDDSQLTATTVPSSSTLDFGPRGISTFDFGQRESGHSRGSRPPQAHKSLTAARSSPSLGDLEVWQLKSGQSHGSRSSRRSSKADDQDEFRILFVIIGASPASSAPLASIPGAVGDIAPACRNPPKRCPFGLTSKTTSPSEQGHETSSLCRIRFVTVESFSASIPVFGNKAETKESAVVLLFRGGGAGGQSANVGESIRDYRMRVAELNFHSKFLPLVLLLCVKAMPAEEEVLLDFARSANLKSRAQIKFVPTITDDEGELISKMCWVADILSKQKSGSQCPSESTPSIELVDGPEMDVKHKPPPRGSKISRTGSKASTKSSKSPNSSRSPRSGAASSNCTAM